MRIIEALRKERLQLHTREEYTKRIEFFEGLFNELVKTVGVEAINDHDD
jgi:hypothetical protein